MAPTSQWKHGRRFNGSEEEYNNLITEWTNQPTKSGKSRRSYRGFTDIYGYFWKGGKPYRPDSKGGLKNVLDYFNRKKREFAQTKESLRINYPVEEGKEAHHRRVLTVFQPFFEGLSKKEQQKLATWMVERGYGTGNIAENFTMLYKGQHQAGIHKWLRDNKVEVEAGDEDWTNFERDSVTGEIVDFKYNKHGEQVAKFPNFQHLRTAKSRLPALQLYLDHVQPAIEEETDNYQERGDYLDEALERNIDWEAANTFVAGMSPPGRGLAIISQGQTGSQFDQLAQEITGRSKQTSEDPFKASAEARQRGSKLSIGGIDIPELGLSEFFMVPNKPIQREFRIDRVREQQSGMSYEDQELYKAGGGNAAMTKYGWTIEQTMLQGRKNLELQRLENTKPFRN